MTIGQRLCEIEIEQISSMGRGMNSCLSLSNFKKDYCLLTGPYSRALFLIPLAPKVSLGGASSYVLCKDHKTKYLNELRPGDELLTMDSEENESLVVVGKNKVSSKYMYNISGKYKISGKEVFELIANNGQNYFMDYRDIFHLNKIKDEKPVNVLDINEYKNKKENICAYLEVALTVPFLNNKHCVHCIGDKLTAYVQMPKTNSRHVGVAYEGCCIER